MAIGSAFTKRFIGVCVCEIQKENYKQLKISKVQTQIISEDLIIQTLHRGLILYEAIQRYQLLNFNLKSTITLWLNTYEAETILLFTVSHRKST